MEDMSTIGPDLRRDVTDDWVEAWAVMGGVTAQCAAFSLSYEKSLMH